MSGAQERRAHQRNFVPPVPGDGVFFANLGEGDFKNKIAGWPCYTEVKKLIKRAAAAKEGGERRSGNQMKEEIIMKKLLAKGIATILFIALTLTMISGSALADTVIASRGKTYVRTEPHKGGSIIGTLQKGNQVSYLNEVVTDYRGIDWYCVSFKGRTGWVSARYTDILSSYNDNSSSSGSSWSDDFYYGRSVIAANGRTYIRSGPSTSAEDLGCLPQGAYANYLNEYSFDRNGRQWYKIKFNGVTGWVSARYTILQ